MQLIVFRHGIAESQGPDGSDFTRRLTEEGKAKTHEAACGLFRLVDGVEAIVTSPLPRARQTADIAADVLGGQVVEDDALAGHEPRRIVEMLAGRSEASLMIVGHEPTLSATIERLCHCSGGHVTGSQGGIQLKKAGGAMLEIDTQDKSPGGTLLWLATPRMLRALGSTV